MIINKDGRGPIGAERSRALLLGNNPSFQSLAIHLDLEAFDIEPE